MPREGLSEDMTSSELKRSVGREKSGCRSVKARRAGHSKELWKDPCWSPASGGGRESARSGCSNIARPGKTLHFNLNAKESF